MMTRRTLAIPHLLGRLDEGYPWWMTGRLPTQQFPHTAPTGGEGGGAGAAGDGTGSSGGSSGDGTGTGGAGEGGSGEGNGEPDNWKEHLSAADRKRAAAEKERDEALSKLKAIEDKDKSELDKATERVSQLEKDIAERDSALAKLRLENAFLTVNEVSWHDPADALDVARRDGYLEGVVKEDGTVDNTKLKAKLTQLADKKKYLVKTTGETPPPVPSGAPLGSGGRSPNHSGEPDTAELQKRYRSLRR